jgi:hypothetical protein
MSCHKSAVQTLVAAGMWVKVEYPELGQELFIFLAYPRVFRSVITSSLLVSNVLLRTLFSLVVSTSLSWETNFHTLAKLYSFVQLEHKLLCIRREVKISEPCDNISQIYSALNFFVTVNLTCYCCSKVSCPAANTIYTIRYDSINKIRKVYCLKYTNIPKMFFTSFHVCRCCTDAMRGAFLRLMSLLH